MRGNFIGRAVTCAMGKKDQSPKTAPATSEVAPPARSPTVDKQLSRSGGPTPASAGVVYIGHIPKGFYEDEMKGFFSQFGDVSRVKVSRSRKSSRARGYGFVEFPNAEVGGCCHIAAGGPHGCVCCR
jgi:nucleolar protein 15